MGDATFCKFFEEGVPAPVAVTQKNEWVVE